ncbi:glycosyltransferase family 25 protein [Moraxella oblonga]|uniref:glycosyltransferase family 25 protein n=1 Tax=Moraxella oblonga TaxID=200413 RepID=UPI000836BAA4|nr:glycosyltransferase family 25 protein [Moraxella oblonga]
MFKGYVINLNHRYDRLYRFNQHPDAKYFERFPAIDKKALEMLGEGVRSLFFDTHKFYENHRREITLGEIACTLSHISVWQKALLDDDIAFDDFIVIAEDDVTLDKHFLTHIRYLNNFLKSASIDLLILQRLLTENKPIDYQNPQFDILTNIKYNYAGAGLYMIKKSRLKIICDWLKSHKPIWLADEFVAFCPTEHTGLLYPLIGVVESEDSDLEHDRVISRQTSKQQSK